MAVASVLFNNFTSGEISPVLRARSDFARYATGAKTLENWLVLLQGGLRTRYGTRYGWLAKYQDRLALARPFEATDAEVYLLEVGHEYLRFGTPLGGLLRDGASVPVEVVTPYLEGELYALRTAQLNDVMILVHKNHPPAQLARLSPTVWRWKPIVFDPPPLYEAGVFPDATLTPSGLNGAITLTASAAVFLSSDVDRVLQAGDVRVAITAVTSPTVATGDVLSAFTTLDPVASGDWRLERSPVADLSPGKMQPVGARISLDLEGIVGDAVNLMTNGDFSDGLTGWTNLSGPVLTTGTVTATALVDDQLFLIDDTQDFYRVGAQPGHLIVNTTNSSQGIAAAHYGRIGLGFDAQRLQGGTAQTLTVGDTYQIRGTGGAEVRNGKAFLTGNLIGTGWLERAVTTIASRTYRVTFRVTEGAVSAQVGSTSGASDLKEELLYEQGNQRSLTFTATGTTAYVQFRNNQPVAGAVDDIVVESYNAEGWRQEDIGKYVKVNDGLVKITAVPSTRRAIGTILRALTSRETAPGGAWQLLEPAWSDTLGWPSFLTFFEGRLYFTGVPRFPQEEWGSKVNDFYNFFEGPNASDALHMQIVDSSGNVTLNAIKWLAPGENLLAGTTHAEYRQTGPQEGAFSATELPLIRLQSTFGSDSMQPIRVGQALLFGQRQGSKIRQMSFEADVAASFLAKDITNLSGHFLTRYRAIEMAYQPEALPLVWVLRSDGQLLTLTYDLTEEVVGWSHQVTQGQYTSVCTVPHPTANTYQTWVSVQRTIAGETVRTFEYFDDQAEMRGRVAIDGVIPSWQGLTLDSALTYDFGETPVATLTGLFHLAGGTVQVLADGAVFGTFPVSAAGDVTLPLPVYRAWAGLPFTCTAETLPLETMLRSGTTHGHERDWKRLVVDLYETIGLKMNGQQMPFRTPGMPMSAGVALFTGKRPVIAPGALNMESTITLVQDQPFPATVLALAGDLDFGGMG